MIKLQSTGGNSLYNGVSAYLFDINFKSSDRMGPLDQAGISLPF
ncbi:hypothetical protein DYBT9275_05992 [Dyadobacter sp. CECT 9275]|uniref:Uncharacterized protein n=1 Tax=Dyadobacter helix TaxID=2822344 RepID=A0A916NER6_9BACT|nr:hypothetical protein DYBT9275_05992 [Dyadobacter sp. CECT 9275]